MTQSGHRPVAQQPVALPAVIPSHPHSGRWCTRKVCTFTPLRTSLMFMVGCSLRAIVMQFLTYFRLAGHLIFLPFASALQATVACLTATFRSSAGVSLIVLATQSLTNLRLAGHLIFFSLASALHAAVVSLREIASALDVLAASAGVGVSAAPLTTTVAIRPAHKAVVK